MCFLHVQGHTLVSIELLSMLYCLQDTLHQLWLQSTMCHLAVGNSPPL